MKDQCNGDHGAVSEVRLLEYEFCPYQPCGHEQVTALISASDSLLQSKEHVAANYLSGLCGDKVNLTVSIKDILFYPFKIKKMLVFVFVNECFFCIYVSVL